jgi:tetratricopeptide (TPR) repeat protein
VKHRAAALVGAVALAVGCVYYNALYNAEQLFHEGERAHREGRDSLAGARFAEVARKAAKGYRQEPDGEWADDALLLMGRAYLRLGDLRGARGALEQAATLATRDDIRLAADLYLGISYVQAGDADTALPFLNHALEGLREGPWAAEGHLWRARILLAAGEVSAGWWDLDRAGAMGDDVRLDAALERVSWGVKLDDRGRAAEGVNRLLTYGEAGQRVDTVLALAERAAARWGPDVAAAFLAGADSARWQRNPRGLIRLGRARLLRATGDTAAAHEEVRRVANGYGASAAEARMELARAQLGQARDLLDARDALPILLPAVSSPEVARMVEGLEEVDRLVERGLADPLAWFAAGELARDRLAAPELARGLFLAYADQTPSDPWAPKALLAALDVTSDEGGRAWLRGRLEGRAESPYVLAARGEPAPGLEVLEEELARRLQEMTVR